MKHTHFTLVEVAKTLLDQSEPRLAGEVLQAILNDISANAPGPQPVYFLDRPTEDYLSPDLKLLNEGSADSYQTVIGWLALAYSTELRRMLDQDSFLYETQRLGFKVKNQAGFQVYKVRAGAFLSEHGIDYVNAYPIGLLRRVFQKVYGR